MGSRKSYHQAANLKPAKKKAPAKKKVVKKEAK